jgi:hypothetical protein
MLGHVEFVPVVVNDLPQDVAHTLLVDGEFVSARHGSILSDNLENSFQGGVRVVE